MLPALTRDWLVSLEADAPKLQFDDWIAVYRSDDSFFEVIDLEVALFGPRQAARVVRIPDWLDLDTSRIRITSHNSYHFLSLKIRRLLGMPKWSDNSYLLGGDLICERRKDLIHSAELIVFKTTLLQQLIATQGLVPVLYFQYFRHTERTIDELNLTEVASRDTSTEFHMVRYSIIDLRKITYPKKRFCTLARATGKIILQMNSQANVI